MYEILDNYKLYCLREKRKIARYCRIGTFRIIVELDNGEVYMYDDMLKGDRLLAKDIYNLTGDDLSRIFRCRLDTAMNNARVSQRELANRIGVTQAAISYYLSGTNEPNLYTIHKLAKALDCSVEDLISIDFTDA